MILILQMGMSTWPSIATDADLPVFRIQEQQIVRLRLISDTQIVFYVTLCAVWSTCSSF